jgi:hypothetical protein
MIIYLYVKTHNKTGLKYLGKTKNDPNKYSGSGLVWKEHIKEHGLDIYTQVLKECNTKEELSYWGRFYSKLYKVTSSMDDYGNRIWANKIDETGGGDGSNWSDPEKSKRTAIKISKTIKEKRVGKAFNQSGTANHMYGKTGALHHNYGKTYSEESCNRISQNHHDVSGSKNPRARKVKITTSDGTEHISYGALTELCNNLGMSASTAYGNLSKGKTHYTKGKLKGYKIEYID